MTQAVTLVFFPTRRCARHDCRAVFVGIDPLCAPCQRQQARGWASKHDVAKVKRASVRKRLGLPA